MNRFCYSILTGFLFVIMGTGASAQPHKEMTWSRDGNRFYLSTAEGIVENILPEGNQNTLITSQQLTPAGKKESLKIKNFYLSDDFRKLLIYTNAKKVWRYETRGDYWVYDISEASLKQLGRSLPPSSLMFAKFSPDGTKVAYVSGHNIYVEDLLTHVIKPLTSNGSRKLINGTFDWAYEEEFDCRDGFRWSPDSRAIAYWQIDARKIKNYLMLNTTDSIYPFVVPVEYPVAGEDPSSCKVGVVDVTTAKTTWLNIPGDAV